MNVLIITMNYISSVLIKNLYGKHDEKNTINSQIKMNEGGTTMVEDNSTNGNGVDFREDAEQGRYCQNHIVVKLEILSLFIIS